MCFTYLGRLIFSDEYVTEALSGTLKTPPAMMRRGTRMSKPKFRRLALDLFLLFRSILTHVLGIYYRRFPVSTRLPFCRYQSICRGGRAALKGVESRKE
jgi:hypothetical protein